MVPDGARQPVPSTSYAAITPVPVPTPPVPDGAYQPVTPGSYASITPTPTPPVPDGARPPLATSYAAAPPAYQAQYEPYPPVSETGNYLIEFEQEHQALFSPPHFITQREIKRVHTVFDPIARQLDSKQPSLKNIDAAVAAAFLQKHGAFDDDALAHNNAFIHRKVAENKDYFDALFAKIDRDIKLDNDQRHAIVTDDEYVLLAAGAGTGKTTTMAAKVKYLVDKCGVNPDDIIVISFTNKTIGELRSLINKKFRIPAKINTFHEFAYDIVRQHSKKPPSVSYSSYRYIYDMLETEVPGRKNLMRNLILFLGYYFDISEDVLNYDDINQYHLFKAQQDYESMKSSLGEYVRKPGGSRMSGNMPGGAKGELLHSVQEVQIANFLYLNGLEYEYQPQYPYPLQGSRKAYTPDFIIRQGSKSAYLEHYALSANGYNAIFTPEQTEKYKQGIQLKRYMHKQYGTTLLETWSVYSDRQPMLAHLREALTKAGFQLKMCNLTQLYKKITDIGKDKYLHKLIILLKAFISQYKALGYGAAGFNALRAGTESPRTLLFLDIAEDVYTYYQEQLRANNLIDFEDMVGSANHYLGEFECKGVTLPYKYIIIDEFQDIARQRLNLMMRLSGLTQAKVAAAGDDWQWAGLFADPGATLFSRFLEVMGSGAEMRLTRAYRSPQKLIDIAGVFISKNSQQTCKKLMSPKSINSPVILKEFDDSANPFLSLARAVESIIGKLLEESGGKQKILLLGRYNFDGFKLTSTNMFRWADNNNTVRCTKYPKAKLTFMTSFNSKGLGFDNVIVLNLFEGKFGFPSQLENDPIMKLVPFEGGAAPYADERRLFYIALTRARNRVYLMAPQNRPSRFLVELVDDLKLAHSDKLNMSFADSFPRRCPVCGFPLKYEFNGNYGLSLYTCTNEPEICDFMTNHPKFMHDIFKCDSAGCDGYMIVKTSNDKPYYGCTNASAAKNCRNTVEIKA